jgi:hypothetical protein
MSMCRADYYRIAEAIKITQLTGGGRARLITNLCDTLSLQYTNFNKDIFIEACYDRTNQTRLGNSI